MVVADLVQFTSTVRFLHCGGCFPSKKTRFLFLFKLKISSLKRRSDNFLSGSVTPWRFFKSSLFQSWSRFSPRDWLHPGHLTSSAFLPCGWCSNAVHMLVAMYSVWLVVIIMYLSLHALTSRGQASSKSSTIRVSHKLQTTHMYFAPNKNSKSICNPTTIAIQTFHKNNTVTMSC